MSIIALVTDASSIDIDFDMPLLIEACNEHAFTVEICEWDDTSVDWSRFDAVVLRSPWDCINVLPAFLEWCEKIALVTQLFNPLEVIRWNLDKHYMADLAKNGVPIVPSSFVDIGDSPCLKLSEFLEENPQANNIVVKPTIGSYSRGVQRFSRQQEAKAAEYITQLVEKNIEVIIQPYLEAIDSNGETNMTYFDGAYSHAIRKSALLMADGTTNAPLQDFRVARHATEEERAVAQKALNITAQHLNLEQPLLYARVDLIPGHNGTPVVLEMEIFEPSLNLPFDNDGAMKFANALAKRVGQKSIQAEGTVELALG